MEEVDPKKKRGSFDPQASIRRAQQDPRRLKKHELALQRQTYAWATRAERIDLLRAGLPIYSIEAVSQQLNSTIREVLALLDLAQTTYNKKKREGERLTAKDSEILLLLVELVDLGLEVFNQEEEKFHRWLRKTNVSLGGVTPMSLFDSQTGIQEVKNSLLRLEYGNLA